MVALASDLLAEPPAFRGAKADPARLADLQALAETLLGDSGGRVQALLGVEPMPTWAMRDGQDLQDAEGTRALPQLTCRNPILRLEVLALPPADLSPLDPALAAAFAGAFRVEAEVDVGPEPFWTLGLWHLPQPG